MTSSLKHCTIDATVLQLNWGWCQSINSLNVSVTVHWFYWPWTQAQTHLNLGMLSTSKLWRLRAYIFSLHKGPSYQYWILMNVTLCFATSRCISNLGLDGYGLLYYIVWFDCCYTGPVTLAPDGFQVISRCHMVCFQVDQSMLENFTNTGNCRKDRKSVV